MAAARCAISPMTVAASDIYGFVGKNGAGKSTVMKMICGDALPTAGEVVLFKATGPRRGPRALRGRMRAACGASAC